MGSRQVQVAVVIGLLAVAFGWRHDRIEDRVNVITDAVPWQCENTVVEQVTSGELVLQGIREVPTMQCRFRFLVVNDSGYDITMERFAFPAGGPHGGAGFQATQLNTIYDYAEGPLPDERDAIWIVNDRVDAGSTQPYEFTVEFRPGGCDAPGVLRIDQWPLVRVRSWGMPIDLEPETIPVAFIGTEHTTC